MEMVSNGGFTLYVGNSCQTFMYRAYSKLERKRAGLLIFIPLLVLIYFQLQNFLFRPVEISIPTIDTTIGIPNTLIYTSKIQSAMSSWHDMNPEMQLDYYNNEQLDSLLNSNIGLLPDYVRDKVKLLPIIEKADLFRYLAIYVYGGVYSDSDVDSILPLNQWPKTFKHEQVELKDLDFIFGIEFISEQTQYAHVGVLPFQLTQFTFAAARNSIVMREILNSVSKSIVTTPQGENFVLQRTGPAIFSRAIIDTIAEYSTPSGVDQKGYPLGLMEMDKLNQEGQLLVLSKNGTIAKGLILPYRAFAYHAFHMSGERPTLTVHRFAGSWKSS